MRVKVTGTEQLTRVADVLERVAGSRGIGEAGTIARRLNKVIKSEAQDITREQREGLAEKMPKSGGLAAALAGDGRYTVRMALAGRGFGVTIVDSWRGHSMKAIDAGTARHPLFGNRKHWYDTAVTPRVMTDVFEKHGPRVRERIVAQLDLLAEEIARET